jgi:hypothetical protein
MRLKKYGEVLQAICQCGLSELSFAAFFNEQISHQLHMHHFTLYPEYFMAFNLKSANFSF